MLDYLITILPHLASHQISPFAIPPLSDMRTRKCYTFTFLWLVFSRLCICTQINSSLFLPTDSSSTKWHLCHLQKEFAIKIKCFNQIQILHLDTFIACIQITLLAVIIQFSVNHFNSDCKLLKHGSNAMLTNSHVQAGLTQTVLQTD